MSQDVIAYFLTWTTYGTWLQGRNPGWIDRAHNQFGSPIPQPDRIRESLQQARMNQAEYKLDEKRRRIVLDTILEVSAYRNWRVWAAHIRSNHIHVVLSANQKPEKVMGDLKAWASRRLKEAFQEDANKDRWTQHGSTLYLWTESAVHEKVEYVINGQGLHMAYYDHRDHSSSV